MEKIDVIVSKSVSLARGESIADFTQRLGEASRQHLRRKINAGKDSFVWMAQATSNSVVLSVSSPEGGSQFYAMRYGREKGGTFTFQQEVEVERLTVYRPKQPMKVTKRLENGLVVPAVSLLGESKADWAPIK